MKRKSLFALSAVVVVAAAALVPVLWSGVDNLHNGAAMAATPADQAALIKKGEYLARAGDCIACHTVRGGKEFAGGLPMATPFGTMFTPNITPDDEYGLGKWTSDDFYRAMHTGRSKDGSLLYPGFPFTSYTKVTRADSDAIYAYLRSVPPVHVPSRPHELKFPFNNRNLLIGWRTLFFREGEYKPDPTKSVEWNRGAYLIEGLGHCGMCHTSINAMGGPVSSAAFAGGLIPLQNWYAPSLASGAEAGVADWPAADVAALLKTGVTPRGAALGPMAEVVFRSTQYLDDADIAAMTAFLKSLPQVPAHAAAVPVIGKEALAHGAALYKDRCASCHGAEGEGGRSPQGVVYAPLAGNRKVLLESPANLIHIVVNGGFPPTTAGNPRPYGMPPFGPSMKDEDIAVLATYVRAAWGNAAPAVSALDVLEAR
jgi:mono/diheme cytochrome c family protein